MLSYILHETLLTALEKKEDGSSIKINFAFGKNFLERRSSSFNFAYVTLYRKSTRKYIFVFILLRNLSRNFFRCIWNLAKFTEFKFSSEHEMQCITLYFHNFRDKVRLTC